MANSKITVFPEPVGDEMEMQAQFWCHGKVGLVGDGMKMQAQLWCHGESRPSCGWHGNLGLVMSWESRLGWELHGNVGLIMMSWESRPSWEWHRNVGLVHFTPLYNNKFKN